VFRHTASEGHTPHHTWPDRLHTHVPVQVHPLASLAHILKATLRTKNPFSTSSACVHPDAPLMRIGVWSRADRYGNMWSIGFNLYSGYCLTHRVRSGNTDCIIWMYIHVHVHIFFSMLSRLGVYPPQPVRLLCGYTEADMNSALPSFYSFPSFLLLLVQCVMQLMRPGSGRNVSCASGDCLASRPEGHSQPREL